MKNVFKSNNGVSYEVLSTAMYRLLTQPQLDSRISFEQYTTVKKCLVEVDKDIEVSVNDGVAPFKVMTFISSFTIGELGEPYCMIPVEHLKLLNKFLGSTINGPKMEFCKLEDKFLFSIDKEYYRTDIRLTTTKV